MNILNLPKNEASQIAKRLGIEGGFYIKQNLPVPVQTKGFLI